MECNRDEATRAKEISEKKFRLRDIAAAKKFALKAQNLYPGLEGISQMLATFDVYLSAENKINGEADFYAILHVNASADDETVKKQYRKLALMLHPDKNKSIGADGAFKLLSEAWSVLSDKGRRLAYDQKRNVKGGLQQKVSQPKRSSSTPGANGFNNFTNSTINSSSNAAVPPPPHPPPAHPPQKSVPVSTRQPKPNTFWTACQLCKMQYEYLRVYLNHNLLCPNCHKPFLAVETASPANGSTPSPPWSLPQQRGSKGAYISGAGGFNANFQWGPFSRTAGAASAGASSSAAAQAANMVHQTYEKVRREREEAQAAARKEEALRRKNPKRTAGGLSTGTNVGPSNNALDREPSKKRRGWDDDGGNGNDYRRDGMEQIFKGQTVYKYFNASTGTYETKIANGVSRDSGMPMARGNIKNGGLSGDLSMLEVRNMLMEKARLEIRKKLNEWASAKATEKGKTLAAANGVARDQNKMNESMADKSQVHAANKALTGSTPDAGTEAPLRIPVSINVPDPDFHDFDNDRSEKSFDVNQVWAAYDDDDGMPRFYALVQKVLSLKPFKMRLSWLNSKSNSELGPLNWVGSGFAKTCGDFRVGRHEVNDTVNVFSHRVRWEKGFRGVIRIVPMKGDVWAVYRNWSPDWNESTLDEVIHKYDMVEVLEDYNDEQGVSVTPLVKVAGFKTVFHRHMDPEKVKIVPREEMFRFSHQVPSWLLTGEEAQNAPKGCRELDPAATPLELLQVITEAKEDEVAETTEQQLVT